MTTPYAEPVLDWFARHARDLPWRAPDPTPWSVLDSEIMLQQTPVARVVPAHRGWLARGPTPAALAAEPAASAAGVGHRASQLRWAGTTRATGVCCSMISLTSTDQGVAPGPRHGRSRAQRANQASTGSA